MRRGTKILMLFTALVAVPLVGASGASASPPTAASGTFTYTSSTFNSVRPAGGNLIVDLSATVSYTGTFSGTSTVVGTLILHADDSAKHEAHAEPHDPWRLAAPTEVRQLHLSDVSDLRLVRDVRCPLARFAADLLEHVPQIFRADHETTSTRVRRPAPVRLRSVTEQSLCHRWVSRAPPR